MKQVHETELLVPSLKIIKDNPNTSTSDLIVKLESVVKLYPKDKEILNNRNDTVFSQTVRNQCGSHLLTNEFGKCVDVIKLENTNTFCINEYGLKVLEKETEDTIEDIINDDIYQEEISKAKNYTAEELDQANNRMPEVGNGIKSSRYKTDARITKTVLIKNDHKCEYALLSGLAHETFITKAGNTYQEGHHLIPMSAQKDFTVNLDREENIISLCPICHRAVHYGSKNEKQKILEKLYNDRINKLRDKGIDITIEDLINKYYL